MEIMKFFFDMYSGVRHGSLSARFFAGLVLTALTMSSAIGQKRGADDVVDAPQAVPTPVVVSGNPTCATLNALNAAPFTHISQDWGLKINRDAATFPSYDTVFTFETVGDAQLQGGAGPDPASKVRVQAGTHAINWLSNRAITAVIVKAGAQANVYPYNPASFGGFPNGDGSNLITGTQNGISHIVFCFESLGPSAAMVSIMGRVTTVYGSGIAKTYVTITDTDGNVRVALTNGFGYYSFDEVEVGRDYIVTPVRKGYQFTPRLISLTDGLADLDFVGVQ